MKKCICSSDPVIVDNGAPNGNARYRAECHNTRCGSYQPCTSFYPTAKQAETAWDGKGWMNDLREAI